MLLFAVVLTAHPASVVNAGFDKDRDLLNVTFKHQVKNNADHFISEVVVFKNKKEIIRQKLAFQDNAEGGTLVFKLNDVKPKDKLEVSTTCNKTGKKAFTLEIK
jgi:desulfoferrodoxin (superoxide reductase-like protein)